MLPDVIRNFWSTKENIYKAIVGIILGVFVFSFVVTQIVRVANANANPLYAFAYVEDSNPSELFPEIAVCPGFFSNGSIGSITSVDCSFISYAIPTQAVDVIPGVKYTIEGLVHTCYKVNQPMKILSRNLTDMIRCSVKSNVNVLSTYYDENTGTPTYWFSWTVFPLNRDTAIGLVKWYFNGKEVGYKVQTVQEEYRFSSSTPEGVQFTVQWDFLGQGKFGEIYEYEFWTGVGVIGGYTFLTVQVFKFFMWIGHVCLKVHEEGGYRQSLPPTQPNNYQSL